jgi:hypothetical protein
MHFLIFINRGINMQTLVDFEINEVSGGAVALALVVNDDGSGGWGVGFSAFGCAIGIGMGVGTGGLNFTGVAGCSPKWDPSMPILL